MPPVCAFYKQSCSFFRFINKEECSFFSFCTKHNVSSLTFCRRQNNAHRFIEVRAAIAKSAIFHTASGAERAPKKVHKPNARIYKTRQRFFWERKRTLSIP